MIVIVAEHDQLLHVSYQYTQAQPLLEIGFPPEWIAFYGIICLLFTPSTKLQINAVQ